MRILRRSAPTSATYSSFLPLALALSSSSSLCLHQHHQLQHRQGRDSRPIPTNSAGCVSVSSQWYSRGRGSTTRTTTPPSIMAPRAARRHASSTAASAASAATTAKPEHPPAPTQPPQPPQTPRSGIVMILSPAKTLDFVSPLPSFVSPSGNNDHLHHNDSPWTKPDCRPAQTRAILTRLQQLSPSELTKLWKVSSKVAATAIQAIQRFDLDLGDRDSTTTTTTTTTTNTGQTLRPCLYAYAGAAYQGLDAPTLSPAAVRYLQAQLRILSAVYGALRPLDGIQPYRLDMGTLWLDPRGTKLSDHWRPHVTATLATALAASTTSSTPSTSSTSSTTPTTPSILLNLASDEYAAAVDTTALSSPTTTTVVVKVVFREEGRVIAVHAKRARGLMVRYVAEHQCTTLDDVKTFDREGYTVREELWTDDGASGTLIFDRPKQPKKGTKRPASK